MTNKISFLIALSCYLIAFNLNSHNFSDSGSAQHQTDATYLGNEAVLITHDKIKVLFDPFFHNDYGQYQLVPKGVREKIFSASPPYDGITAIVISHAHEDHFSAQDMVTYLTQYPKTKLIAPKQAIDMLMGLDHTKALLPQITSVELGFNDRPWQQNFTEFAVDAVRIPHAGWPGRADVENIVFRVSIKNGSTIMHLGDADPDDEHYLPYRQHWQKTVTNTSFPPYWFFFSAEGRDILNHIINANHHTGIHVPVKTPNMLKNSEHDYFSIPEEKRTIN